VWPRNLVDEEGVLGCGARDNNNNNNNNNNLYIKGPA
jgi:hypothetical protein